MRKLIAMFVLMALAAVGGCAPSFSDLQSAKLVEKGGFEAAANYSGVSFSAHGESDKVQDNYGIQFAYGIADNMNLRFRYERIEVDGYDLSANVWAAGPKIRLLEDRLALFLPVGFATGEDIETSDSWQFHPTFLGTISYEDYFEFNASVKYLIRFCEDCDPLVAFNFGLGLSNDLNRYAIRPEVGFLFSPGDEGHYMHVSVGLSTFF